MHMADLVQYLQKSDFKICIILKYLNNLYFDLVMYYKLIVDINFA
jgi:hypothetical protein